EMRATAARPTFSFCAPIGRSEMKAPLKKRMLRRFAGVRIPVHTLATLSFLALASCADPFADATMPPEEGEGPCPASREWLPNTPPIDLFKPLPHPAGECPFYRGGFQAFLIATQPGPDGRPAFPALPTTDNPFEPHPTGPRSELGDIKQAGQRELMIDQNGNTLYYSIQFNDAYRDFIIANNLQTLQGLQSRSEAERRSLFFPAGLMEFKSAWQIIEDGDPFGEDTFITAEVTVPTIRQIPGTTTKDGIIEDRSTPR